MEQCGRRRKFGREVSLAGDGRREGRGAKGGLILMWEEGEAHFFS